jgi:heme exporter protein CcmD
MTHFGYVLAAYLVTALILLGTVAVVAFDLRGVRRRLQRLEDDGQRGRAEIPR